MLDHFPPTESKCSLDDRDTSTAISVGLTSGSDIGVSGCFSGTADFDPGSNTYNLTSAGDQDAFVLYLKPNGDFAWAMRSGGAEYDAALDLSGIYVTGVSGNDCFVMKLGKNGAVTWTRSTSGTGMAVGTALDVDSNGAVHIAGYFQGAVDFNPGDGECNFTAGSNGEYSVFVLTLYRTGDFDWARDGISKSLDVPFVDITLMDDDSSFLLYSTTTYNSSDSTYTISDILARISKGGTAEWAIPPFYSVSVSGSELPAGQHLGKFAVADDWTACITGAIAGVANVGIPSQSFTSVGAQDVFISQIIAPTASLISSFNLDREQLDNNQQPAGTLIGTFSQSVPLSSTIQYSLVSAFQAYTEDDNDCFYIDGNQLKTTEKFSFVGKSSYLIRVRATDEYGQWMEKWGYIRISDVVSPKVTIDRAPGQTDPAPDSPITFRVVFSEPAGLAPDDVTLSGTAPGKLEATVTRARGDLDYSSYDVVVRGMTGPGTVVATIAAGVTSDASGNLGLASTSTNNSVYYTAGAPFEDYGSMGLIGVGMKSTAVWGDYDNDGLLDILLAGYATTGDEEMVSRVYHNDGNGMFHDIHAGLYSVSGGSLAWGDYDNDGRLDILMTGQHSEWVGTNIVNTTVTKLYHNDGNGVFTEVSTVLSPISGPVDWGDYDGDGRLDILLTGYADINGRSEKVAWIYHNDGNGVFRNINAGLPSTDVASAAWGDYDNDGLLDLVLETNDFAGSHFVSLYHNDGNSAFSDVTENLGLTGTGSGSPAWGDFNNDGLLDLLLSLNENNARNWDAVVCLNNGDGTFSTISTGLPAAGETNIAWGDYDNDGRLDILLNAYDASYFENDVKVYHNDGNGEFHDLNLSLPGTYSGTAQWGDYNNDGRLDILLSGLDSHLEAFTRVYVNNTLALETQSAALTKSFSAASAAADAADDIDANTRPTAPTNLKATILSTTSAKLSWNAATDAETSADGLTYSIRVGTTPGGCDVATATASASGLRRLAEQGAIEGTSWTLTGLKTSKTYYWSVQAVDTSFAGSAFATEGKFTLVKPTFALTAPTSGTVTAGQSVTVAWTAGNVPAGSNVSLCYDKDTTFWNGNETWIEIGAVAAANGKATYTWNTTGVAPGTYYVGGYLWANGSPTWSHLTKSITIKAPPAPTFTLTAPTSGTVVAGKNASITWTAANVPAGSTVSLCYDTDTKLWNGNETWIEINKITAADGKGTYTWNTAGVAPGTYYIGGYLWANGKSTCSHLTKSITIQAGPTVRGVVAVEATEPRDKVLTTNESILMTWNAIDADGVAGSTLLVDGKNVAVKGPYRTTSGSNFSAKLGLLTAGVHTYSIVATDKLGYKTATPLTGTFTVTAALLDKAFASCLDEKEKDWWMA